MENSSMLHIDCLLGQFYGYLCAEYQFQRGLRSYWKDFSFNENILIHSLGFKLCDFKYSYVCRCTYVHVRYTVIIENFTFILKVIFIVKQNRPFINKVCILIHLWSNFTITFFFFFKSAVCCLSQRFFVGYLCLLLINFCLLLTQTLTHLFTLDAWTHSYSHPTHAPTHFLSSYSNIHSFTPYSCTPFGTGCGGYIDTDEASQWLKQTVAVVVYTLRIISEYCSGVHTKIISECHSVVHPWVL